MNNFTPKTHPKVQECLNLAQKWAFLPEARYVEVSDPSEAEVEAGILATVAQKIGSWELIFVVHEDCVEAYTLDQDDDYVYLGSQEDIYAQIADLG